MTRWLCLVAITACANPPSPSKQDAAAAMAETTSALEIAQYNAVSATVPAGQAVPYSIELAHTGPCSGGGTATVTGHYATGVDASFANDFMMNHCADVLGMLDGNAHEDATTVGTAFAMTISGDLVFTANDGTVADCAYHLLAAVDATTTQATYSGTVCGFDATTLFTN